MRDRDGVSQRADPEREHERPQVGWPDLARIALVTLAAGYYGPSEATAAIATSARDGR